MSELLSHLQGLILVLDSVSASGGFLIPHLLQAALKEKQQVVLVLVSECLSHYQHVLRKLGINLAACIESQQVRLVELLSDSGDLLSSSALLDQLQQKLQEADRDGATSVCLAIDSLSALRYLLPSEEWIPFLLACLSLRETVQNDYCFLTRVHTDIEDDALHIKLLQHAAKVTIEVDTLESAEVTGQLHVTQRDHFLLKHTAPQEGPAENPRRHLLYKLTESGLQLMPRNTVR